MTAAVPIPADRPFDLGQGEVRQPSEAVASVAARPAVRQAVAVSRAPMPAPAAAKKTASVAPPPQARDRSSQSFASRFEPAAHLPTAPARVESVSAFAPSRASNGAVMSGRGLY
jgi:hypothetical protein